MPNKTRHTAEAKPRQAKAPTANQVTPRPTPPQQAAPEATLPASINIDNVVLEGFGPISASAFREGFSEAWKRDSGIHWKPEMAKQFTSGLDLKLPKHATSRQIGAHLAKAILERASSAKR